MLAPICSCTACVSGGRFMSHRVVPCSLGGVGLVLVAVALWFPPDVSSGKQPDPAPEPAGVEAKLIASACPFAVTFRPADFLGDDLVKAILQDVPRFMERELHVTA